MAIIEILCLAGVLKKVKLHTDLYSWELTKEWDKNRIYMQKKLVSLAFSY